MRALVYSIPGSGTRFTLQFLVEALGYEKLQPHELQNHVIGDRQFTQWHVRRGHSSLITDLVEGGAKVVIPLRSPVATAITRESHLGPDTVVRVKDLWRILRERIDRFDYILLPVEAPWFSHLRLLELVAQHLQMEPNQEVLEAMADKWPRVGCNGYKPERGRYDWTGQATIQGEDSSVFDEETAWYIQLLAEFAAGPYRSAIDVGGDDR
jgi:hypothetical protein